MKDESTNVGGAAAGAATSLPAAVDRATFQAELDSLRVRLATTVARRRRLHADERTPHRPVVATRSWTQ